MKTLLVVALVLVAVPAFAEEQPAAWSAHRTIPARLSDAAVATQIGGSLFAAWRSPDRKAGLWHFACREGFVLAVTETLKRTTHRLRPDGSDRLSFPSGHTATAVAHGGWNYQLSVPIDMLVGYGRAGAGRHYWTDIAAGAGVGWLAKGVCR